MCMFTDSPVHPRVHQKILMYVNLRFYLEEDELIKTL